MMSMRLRLSLTIGSAFVLVWALAAAWMLSDLRQQMMFSLDQRLVASARMVAGQDLVRISLMADIPHDAVFRGVVEVVQRGGQFDHAQIGTEVATGLAGGLDEIGAQLIGDGAQLVFVESAKLGRGINAR